MEEVVYIKNRKNIELCLKLNIDPSRDKLCILEHGLGARKEYPHMRVFEDEFAKFGYNVINIDASDSINASGSSAEGITFSGHLSDLEDVIDWAKTQNFYHEPFVLSGQSLGARTCAVYASTHPTQVSQLFCAALPWLDNPLQDEYIAEIAQKIKSNGQFEKVSKSTGKTLIIKPTFIEDINKIKLSELAPKILAETFVIVGDLDLKCRKSCARKFYNLLKCNKHFDILKNVPHDMANTEENKATFEKYLDMQLSKISGTKYRDYESIIPTALHTAYPLIFTDIPHSKDMFDALSSLGFPENLKNEKLSVELEARYKLISQLLEQSQITQVLELACGYTCRGLNSCLENSDTKYVEFDLPQIINTKIALLNRFCKTPSNLKFVSGNALDFDDLKSACRCFDKRKPIAVINQGFMRYLSFEEKRKLAQNIYKIIAKNGGIWITSDVTPAPR